jgi:hypothetical protein
MLVLLKKIHSSKWRNMIQSLNKKQEPLNEERFLHSKFKINIVKIGRLNRPVVRFYIKSKNLPIIVNGQDLE